MVRRGGASRAFGSWMMLVAAAAAALSSGVQGCALGSLGPGESTATSSGTGNDDASTHDLRGEEAFSALCASCHGSAGEGGGSGPQILNPVVDYATFVVRNGRDDMGFPGPMAAYSVEAVPEEQLTSILDWLREADKPAAGKDLYVRFCANCHGSDAQGGRADEEVAGEELDDIEERVRKGHAHGEFAKAHEYMPSWPDSELSKPEVSAIAAYLHTLGGGDDDGDDDDDDD